MLDGVKNKERQECNNGYEHPVDHRISVESKDKQRQREKLVSSAEHAGEIGTAHDQCHENRVSPSDSFVFSSSSSIIILRSRM
jgi:hypothetical protein